MDRSTERKGSGVALIINNIIKFCGIYFPKFLGNVDNLIKRNISILCPRAVLSLG